MFNSAWCDPARDCLIREAWMPAERGKNSWIDFYASQDPRRYASSAVLRRGLVLVRITALAKFVEGFFLQHKIEISAPSASIIPEQKGAFLDFINRISPSSNSATIPQARAQLDAALIRKFFDFRQSASPSCLVPVFERKFNFLFFGKFIGRGVGGIYIFFIVISY